MIIQSLTHIYASLVLKSSMASLWSMRYDYYIILSITILVALNWDRISILGISCLPKLFFRDMYHQIYIFVPWILLDTSLFPHKTTDNADWIVDAFFPMPWPWHCLIFTMRIPVLVRRHLYIDTVPVITLLHYGDVIMNAIASQITSLTIVYSTVYLDADQSKHQSSASLAFVWGIHRGPVNSPHKWPVTRKLFPFDDVIMVFCNVVQLKMNMIQNLVGVAVVMLIPTLQQISYIDLHEALNYKVQPFIFFKHR